MERNNGMGPTALLYIRLLTERHSSDLYAGQSSQDDIYSVCFSPNSDYLATGGEDGQIRVSYRFFARLTARHGMHAGLRHTAIASATTDDLFTLN